MAMPSPNGSSNSDPPNTKFKRGNKLGRGNPLGRTHQLFRVQLIRELKVDRSIPLLVKRLKEMAIKGTRTVIIREKDEITGKMKRNRLQQPVDAKVQLVAIQELLSRAVGKATEFKVIEDNRADKGKQGGDFENAVKMLLAMRTPFEIWPIPVLAWHQKRQAKQVESKPVEPT